MGNSRTCLGRWINEGSRLWVWSSDSKLKIYIGFSPYLILQPIAEHIKHHTLGLLCCQVLVQPQGVTYGKSIFDKRKSMLGLRGRAGPLMPPLIARTGCFWFHTETGKLSLLRNVLIETDIPRRPCGSHDTAEREGLSNCDVMRCFFDRIYDPYFWSWILFG